MRAIIHCPTYGRLISVDNGIVQTHYVSGESVIPNKVTKLCIESGKVFHRLAREIVDVPKSSLPRV